MSLIHSPRIVTDGLKLVLDAGVPTSWNVGISTNWTDKVGGNNGTLLGGTYHNDGPFVDAGYVEFVKSDNDGFNVSNSTGWFNPNNTSQWTLEGWILNPSSTNVFGVYSGTWGSIANFGCAIGGSVSFQSGNGGWSWVTNSTIVADTGSPTGWNHFAFTKNGSTFEVFLNGSRIYTGTPTFGTGTTGGSVHLQSYFSNTLYYNDAAGLYNVRYVTGSVLYSGTSYTVPTEPLTAISGTQLLIYQGNTFTDASPNNLTLTVQNSPTANLGYPASAFEFDGTNDYVQVSNSSALQLGTGDFTIEMWWYMIGSGNCRGFTLGDAYDANGMELYLGSSGTSLNVYIENATRITADSVPSFDTWHHYVIERTSGTMKLYIDGVVQSGTYSSSQSLGTGTDGDLRIGVEYYNGGLSFVGDCKISNFKIYKGKGLTAAEVLQNYNALKRRYA